DGAAQGLGVHVGHGQHGAVDCILHDGRHQAVALAEVDLGQELVVDLEGDALGDGGAHRYSPVPLSLRVEATAWMSRSRRITYSSPCTSTSKRSSGLKSTVSPTLTVRT